MMKRAGPILIFLTVCAVVMALAVPASSGFLQNSTGLVSMEAEHYQGNVPLGSYAWMPVANPGSSGTGALQALPDDTPSSLVAGAGPRMDYQVQFTKTGTHYIWIRALAHSGGSDSLYVGLDGGTAGAVYMTGLNWDGVTWKWSKQKSGGTATINVTSTGLHTINVWMRESGVVLDKLVLTTSSSYTPTGTGPAETVGSTVDFPPTVTTNTATYITIDNATVNGGVNPNGLATTTWFEWGTDPSLASFQRHYHPVPGVRDVEPGGERSAVGVKFGDALLLPGGGFQLRGDKERDDRKLHDRRYLGVQLGDSYTGEPRTGYGQTRLDVEYAAGKKHRGISGHPQRQDHL